MGPERGWFKGTEKQDVTRTRIPRAVGSLTMNDKGLHNLFVYGTLLDDGLLRRLVGRTFPKVTGKLEGYFRVEEKPGFPYPSIKAQAGAFLEGMVLMGIRGENLFHLDAYEGRAYERIEVKVHTDRGFCEAWVYAGISEG